MCKNREEYLSVLTYALSFCFTIIKKRIFSDLSENQAAKVFIGYMIK